MESLMRGIFLIFLTCLAFASANAGAVTISPTQDLGAVPASAGTGLLGSYYKFSSSSNIGSLSQANILISASGGPTATFRSTTVCFPDCAGTSVADTTTMTGLVGSNASNFTYTVPNSQIPTSIDHSAMVLNGYIAITQAGTYNFNLGSDDGSQLVIGGQTIISNDGDHGFGFSSGSATFSAVGLYAISIEYFEDSGSTGLDFYASNSAGSCIIGRAANCAAGTTSTGLLYSSVPTATPEPASLSLFAVGLCGLAFVRRQRRRNVLRTQSL
jgi:hypothetical protein